MILIASSGLVNLMIRNDADLLAAFLVSKVTCLISALGMNGYLSYRISLLISSNESNSIVMVRLLCANIPYVGLRTLPYPKES